MGYQTIEQGDIAYRICDCGKPKRVEWEMCWDCQTETAFVPGVDLEGMPD